MSRYDNIKDIRTPEEIAEFQEEFTDWLVHFTIELDESCRAVDKLEEE